MNELSIQHIIAPIVASIIAGIGYLVKRYFAKRDEDKADMKKDISDLKSDLKKTDKKVDDMVGMIIRCKHADCPTKELLADYWNRKE